MKKYIVIIVLAILGVSACNNKPETLNYSVLLQGASFKQTSEPEQFPGIIVIASKQEIVPPVPEYTFIDEVSYQLNNIDYDHYFVILLLVTNVPERVQIKEIVRQNNQVTIREEIKLLGVGGEYVLLNYSRPYRLLSVEKKETWNKDIEFAVVDEESGDTLEAVKHYIP